VRAAAADLRVDSEDWVVLERADSERWALVLERVKVPVRVAVAAVRAFG